MLADIIKTFKHTFFFGLGTLTTSFAGLLLVPLYVRVLTLEEFGLLEIVLVTTALLSRILSLEMHSGLLKYYIKADHESERHETIGTAVFFLVPVMLVLTSAAIIAAPWISEIIFGSKDFVDILRLGAGIVCLTVVLTLPLGILRARERPGVYALIAIAQFLLTIGLILGFVLVLKQGVVGVLAGQVLALALTATLSFMVVARDVRFSFSRLQLGRIISFGAPLAFVNIAGFILNSSDRYMLAYFAGPAEMGVYSLGYKVSSAVFPVLIMPFQLAWPAVVFSVERQDYSKLFYARMLTYVAAIGAFFILMLNSLSPFIIRAIAPPAYRQAESVVLLVSSAYLAYLLCPILAVGFYLKNQTKRYAYVFWIAAIANLLINYLLIPRFGMFGAAFSTFVCYLGASVLVFFVSRHLYDIKYEWRRVFVAIGIAYLSIAILQVVKMPSPALDLFFRLMLVITFPLWIYLAGFFQETEIASVRAAFTGMISAGAQESS